ncbi:MAG TPA: response regulator [Candidatus Nitrosotenuis sp.]|nr:response regulator [Candidatus Nitrosotenuis sp.]
MKPVVLVVDDYPPVLKLCAAALEPLAQVVVASTADEALALASGADLVLTDFCMPGKNGLQLLREVRRLRPQLAAVMMTSTDLLPGEIEELEAMQVPLLRKPFVVAELQQVVGPRLPSAQSAPISG